MSNRELYSLVIPENAQTLTRSEIERNIAKHGLLDSANTSVESVSLEPGQQVLRGQYRGRYARLMAAEVEELFDASGFSAVPFYDPDRASPEDSYYALENVDIEALDPNLDEIREFDGVLTKKGTREGKRRSVATTVKQHDNQDFGNDQTAYIGVPGEATAVEWLNAETQATESVSVVETRECEHGSVEIVDAQASSYTSPSLVYDLAYEREGKVDVVVWDDHGREKLDEDGINTWQWCFSASHEFAGTPRIENGLVRVSLDTAGGLEVEAWDDAASEWSSVSLGSSSWEFDGWDITRITPVRVDAQCRFIDPSQNPTASYSLDMSLKRGWEWPQWIVPPGEEPPTPSGLIDLLDPVADESDYSPQGEQGLVDRTAVRA